MTGSIHEAFLKWRNTWLCRLTQNKHIQENTQQDTASEIAILQDKESWNIQVEKKTSYLYEGVAGGESGYLQ